ncbi:MAG TPA: hypothetical protein VFE62_29705 [Gemmataceae bacterium]|nr:hypothetical protein [Gemmataceae bacterium]
MLALREAIERLGWQAQAWKGGSVVCLDATKEQREVGLENLYRRLRREPRDTWPDLLVDLLGSVPAEAGKAPENLSEVADQLMVRLGPPVRGQGAEVGIWSMPLVDRHLSAFLVIDFPTSMSYVNDAMIASSGQAADYWFQRGLANLRDKSAPTCFAPVHDESGLLQAQASDAYDSSRALLVDELIPGHEEDGFYVIVPGRDHCFVLLVTAESLMLAPWLRSIAIKMCKDMPYPISPELFWVRGGLWHHFEIEEGGNELRVTPPAAFVEIMERLRPDIAQPPEQDDSDSLPN